MFALSVFLYKLGGSMTLIKLLEIDNLKAIRYFYDCNDYNISVFSFCEYIWLFILLIISLNF